MPLDAPSLKTLRVGKRAVPLLLKRDGRAQRITLRIDQQRDGVQIVLPRRTPLTQALCFAQSNSAWILEQLDGLPPRVPFKPGARIPILGREHEIVHDPHARSGVWRQCGRLWVSGFREHLPRRVTDYLKAEAKREIVARVEEKTQAIRRRPGRIAVRDTRTRWGSCAESGDLSFSWRLIFAPEYVFDYLVAHEVAHLVYMDHSKRFWDMVGRLTEEVEAARCWLTDNGPRLYRYG